MTGRGHVRRRGRTWTVVVELPRDPATGERRQESRGGYRTRREAEEAKVKRLREIDTGLAVDPTALDVAGWLDQWFASARPSLRRSTADNYRTILDRHVIPALGHIPLARLGPAHVQAWIAGLWDKGLGGSRVVCCYNVLHRAMRAAVGLRVIAVNPCDGITERPSYRRTERRVWTEAESRAAIPIIAAHERFPALFLLILGTGLRKGEALGLRWGDLDLDRGVLAVRRALGRAGGEHYLDDPKSASGRRAIHLPAFVIEALRAHRAAQNIERLQLGPLWDGEDRVFVNAGGAPLTSFVVSGQWGRIRRRLMAAGLPYCTIHDLRHAHATIGLAAGVHPKVMSERLGHSSVGITLDLYSHVTATMQERAAQAIERALRPPADDAEGRAGEGG